MPRTAGVKNGWTAGSDGVNANWSEPAGSGGITVEEFAVYRSDLDGLVLDAFEIDDAVTSTEATWSSTRIQAALDAI